MRRVVLALALVIGACAAPPKSEVVDPTIRAELDAAAARKPPPAPAPVQQALLPPLRMEMPNLRGQAVDQRFDLSVNNAPAPQVFLSIVSGTRFSMLVHPSVNGMISVHLKDVTIREALDAIRDLYGYEYRITGSQIFIEPIELQSRVYNVNYLIGQRLGRSDLRVTSGSVGDAPGVATGLPGVPGAPGTAPLPSSGVPGGPGSLPGVNDSSRIQTQTRNDFWDELEKTLHAMVGAEPGRSVVVNTQAGVVVVRAMPSELRGVERYLRAIRLSVERQVVLEAKIIEVTLNSQYQSGINWAAFSAGGLSAGQVSPGTALQSRAAGRVLGSGGNATGAVNTGDPGSLSVANPSLGAAVGASLINFALPGASLFGLAFQARNFAALLNFLESQGAVQVLSSPRIATINNQKAVLKVGTDQFFLTNISGSTTTTTTVSSTGAATPAFPTITLRPFFSGVALDITPQIDEDSNIILHIHPSVSDVQTDNRQINLGQTFGGQVTLPLARSDVSETDSIVKVGDGNIVAIGGLMKIDIENNNSGLPGAQGEPILGSRSRTMVKKELVILVKPTVVQTGGMETSDDVRQTRERILNMLPAPVEKRPQ